MKTKGSWRNNYQSNKFLFQIRFFSNRFFFLLVFQIKRSQSTDSTSWGLHKRCLMSCPTFMAKSLPSAARSMTWVTLLNHDVYFAGIDSRTNLTTFSVIFSHYLSDPLQSRFVDRKPFMKYKSLHSVRQERRRLSPSFGSFLVWNQLARGLYSRRWWQKLRHL